MARPDKRTKKANRKAVKGGKVLKKGQSASYNPAFNKHRLEAKKRAVFGNAGTCNLTEAKLAEHNKLTTSIQVDENEDLMSTGGDTAVTAFTNCSLPTFNRLLKNWNAGSLLHKEMLAILAAVTDVLKANGGKETETEYFAALMTTLDVVETDEGLTAVVCLLHMVVKRLNESLLKFHCKTASETFMKLLIKYMNSDHCALLRNLLNIIYAFFKVKSQWTDFDGFGVLLEFTTHQKPKVRRTAHQIVRTLLVDHIPTNSTVHPASSVAANFCIQKLERNGGPSASRDVFYILSLLQEIIGVLPKANIKMACETILKVMTLSNAMVTSSCLKTLQGLYLIKPKPEVFPVDLNARLIQALYDYQPNAKDTHSVISWLQLMEAAFINLNMLDSKLCYGHLPKLYSSAVKCWQTDSDELMSTVTFTLNNLLYKCIDPASEVFQCCLLDDPINNPPHKMFHSVEEALSYQYHKAWKHVLNVLAVFFEVIGKHCYTVMLKCLGSLADMHDSYKFPCISDLERAVGMAVEHMGPQIVLRAIPLQFSDESDKPDFPRSWLLPLLRDYVKKTELNFFIKYFLPLAAKVKNKALVLQQEGKTVESKLQEVICSQIWSLLPGFCTEPTDLKQCFREVARTLGIILKDEPSLRMTVLSSLRLLINKNMENEENKAEIAKFGKNYLPILFNLYTTEPKDKSEEKVRLAVYETCKSYLQIIDSELCHTFFTKALEKLQSSESNTFMLHALIDLCKAMLPYVDEISIQSLYEYCKPLLKDTNHTIQKKSFGVMSELCNSQSQSCRAFVKSHLEELRALFCSSASNLMPATKSLRLNCLKYIVNQLTENEKECIIAIIPEAVLCTKENSVKARTAAYNLLVEIGLTLKRWHKNQQEALREYMKLLLAGLAGTPHMMSATVLAVGRVMYEFKDDLDSDLIHLLIENMCLLITSRSREVVVSALSFMKILFSTLDSVMLAQHVEYMVNSITHISEDNQRHFRFKAKELFTRLIRKFGYEMISKLVPENYQKQLLNIRKLEARKARKKQLNIEENDSESESYEKTDVFESVLADSEDELPAEENIRKQNRYMKKKKTRRDPLIEEHDDDIVDFMDPTVNKRLLSSKMEKQFSTKKIAGSFPVAEDGRIIIQDDGTSKKSKGKVEMDEKSMVMAELGAAIKKKKRKYEDSDDEEGEEEKEQQTGAQFVERGIHRNIGPKQKKCLGAEYKAKNAGGDVKRGKFEPYAYIPLNRQFLNKRKQVKVQGQFKNIVRAAKRGAVTGVKRKMREARKRKGTK